MLVTKPSEASMIFRQVEKSGFGTARGVGSKGIKLDQTNVAIVVYRRVTRFKTFPSMLKCPQTAGNLLQEV